MKKPRRKAGAGNMLGRQYEVRVRNGRVSFYRSPPIWTLRKQVAPKTASPRGHPHHESDAIGG